MINTINTKEQNLDQDLDRDMDQDHDQNKDQKNTNDTIEDHFQYLLDKAIEYGDCTYIKKALILYSKNIGQPYIELANKIYLELVEEKIEDMCI